MNYYILFQSIEDEEEDAMLAGYSEYLDRIRVPFDEGELVPIEDILLPIEILVEEASLRGRFTDYLIVDDVDCSLISKKAKEVFEKKEITNFQTLPIKLIDSYANADEVEEAKLKDEHLEYKEVIYEDYEIFNATSLLDCINHEASNLEYYVTPVEIPDDLPENMREAMQQEEDNDIDFIRKLILDESKIPDDIKIFRLKDCPRILVFKEEIVKAIREAKLTGFVFVPLSEYTDEIPDDDEEEEEKITKETQKAEQQRKEPLPEEKPKPTSGIIIKGIRRND